MFEARLAEGALFKKIIDCIKELCKDINFDIAEDGPQKFLKHQTFKFKNQIILQKSSY